MQGRGAPDRFLKENRILASFGDRGPTIPEKQKPIRKAGHLVINRQKRQSKRQIRRRPWQRIRQTMRKRN